MSQDERDDFDDPAAARAMVRDLRATIAALRDELEARALEAQEGYRESTSEAAREIVHLQDMIASLRGELEAAQNAREVAIHEACAERDGEIKQLRETVAQLREELEALQPLKEKDPEAEMATADYARHLQTTVQRMREQLEKQWSTNSANVSDLHHEFEKERRQLQDTISALRTELEETRGTA